MRIKPLINIPVWTLMFVCVNSAFAQNTKDTLASMTSVSKSTYRPVVAEATKISESPVVIDSTKKLPISPYVIFSQKVNTSFDVQPIAPAQMLGEPLQKLYNSLIKIGMGTYTTPYGEIWVNKLRSKEYAGGIRAKHLSSSFTSKNFGYAGFNNDEIGVYGKKFLKKHSLIGNADYTRNTVHVYGYDPAVYSLDRNASELRYNFISANARLKSHFSDPKKLNHDIKVGAYTFMDRYDSFENNANVSGAFNTAIHRKEILNVNVMLDYYNYKTTADTINNTIVSINPNIIFADSNYKVVLGPVLTMDKFNTGKYYFYPNVYFSYNVFENIIIPYVSITGGLQKNSFKNLTDANPFVLSQLPMNNSNKLLELLGGLKGTLSSTTSFDVHVSQQTLNNMAMFVNDTNGYKNQFNVIYDNAKILHIRGEAAYQLREKIRVNLAGDYYDYKMKSELRAWYKPQVQVTLSGNYNIKDKIIAKLDVFYISGQYAKTYQSDTTLASGVKIVPKELNGLVDINIGAEYRYNKKLGFFVNFNNIANFRYYRWLNYPTQKFNLMAGLSYSF